MLCKFWCWNAEKKKQKIGLNKTKNVIICERLNETGTIREESQNISYLICSIQFSVPFRADVEGDEIQDTSPRQHLKGVTGHGRRQATGALIMRLNRVSQVLSSIKMEMIEGIQGNHYHNHSDVCSYYRYFMSMLDKFRQATNR